MSSRSSSKSTSSNGTRQHGVKEPAATIIITNMAVEGLSMVDGEPDPYISVRVGTTVQETSPERHCCHARWPDSFTFAMTSKDTLYLTVWDDVLSENVGELWLTAHELVADWTPGQGSCAVITASLKGPHGHAGIVSFNVLSIEKLASLFSALPGAPTGASSTDQPALCPPPPPPPPPPPLPPSQFPLAAVSTATIDTKVTVVGAHGLDTLCNCPNTYVAIRDGASIWRTATCPQTSDPEWNAEFLMRLAPVAKLSFELVHEGHSGNSVLANFCVPAQEIPALVDSGGRFGLKYTLRGRRGEGCGVLIVRFGRVDPAMMAASKPIVAQPRGIGVVHGRLVAPVVQHSPPSRYAMIDVNGGCLACQCGGAKTAEPHQEPFLRPDLLDPTALWELSVNVQGAFLTTSSSCNVFVTVRCSQQYHKTSVRCLLQGEVVWDEQFGLSMGPTDFLEVAILETDGASIRPVCSAMMRRPDLTSMMPLHEVWLQVKTSGGRRAGELLLSIDVSKRDATPARTAPRRSVHMDPSA
eukprot:GGOE01065509.1.p1 GENE.GGOE01065509.1~~GGOE01065509.1.p1  ORF type:complete len:568 (-),score=97.46 GGOE01065509.1:494-2071(-)